MDVIHRCSKYIIALNLGYINFENARRKRCLKKYELTMDAPIMVAIGLGKV